MIYLQLKIRQCKKCGKEFKEQCRGQNFCSSACYDVYFEEHKQEIWNNMLTVVM